MSEILSSDESDDDKPLISDRMLEKAYSAIKEFAVNFDIDSIAQAVKSIEKYKLPDTEKERFGKLKQAAEDFDWDMVEELLSDK